MSRKKTVGGIVGVVGVMAAVMFLCGGCGGDSNSVGGNPDGSRPGGGKPTPTITTFIDERDGNVYKKVTIGQQVWMAENLNYDIPDENPYIDECYFDSCDVYGRSYGRNVAIIDFTRGPDASIIHVNDICPSGWHLPNDKEWRILYDYVGCEGTYYYYRGTNEYGFSAIGPSGACWISYNVDGNVINMTNVCIGNGVDFYYDSSGGGIRCVMD